VAASIDSLDKEHNVRGRIKFDQRDYIKHAFSGNDYHDEAYMAFGANEVPMVYVIDPDGKIAAYGDSIGDVDCHIPGYEC